MAETCEKCGSPRFIPTQEAGVVTRHVTHGSECLERQLAASQAECADWKSTANDLSRRVLNAEAEVTRLRGLVRDCEIELNEHELNGETALACEPLPSLLARIAAALAEPEPKGGAEGG